MLIIAKFYALALIVSLLKIYSWKIEQQCYNKSKSKQESEIKTISFKKQRHAQAEKLNQLSFVKKKTILQQNHNQEKKTSTKTFPSRRAETKVFR